MGAILSQPERSAGARFCTNSLQTRRGLRLHHSGGRLATTDLRPGPRSDYNIVTSVVYACL